MNIILFLLSTYTFTLRSQTLLIPFLQTSQELSCCQVLDSALSLKHQKSFQDSNQYHVSVVQMHSPRVQIGKVLVKKLEAIAITHRYTVDLASLHFIWSIGNRFSFQKTSPTVILSSVLRGAILHGCPVLKTTALFTGFFLVLFLRLTKLELLHFSQKNSEDNFS